METSRKPNHVDLVGNQARAIHTSTGTGEGEQNPPQPSQESIETLKRKTTKPIPGTKSSTVTNPYVSVPKPTDRATASTNGSTYATLEPYEPTNNKGKGRSKRQGNNRNFLPDYPALRKNIDSHHIRYFIIHSDENRPPWKAIDRIQANNELEDFLQGEPARVNELRNGDLLVEVRNEAQSRKIKHLTKLNSFRVTVTPHKSLNYTKGTIHSKAFSELDDEILLKALEKSNVVSLYKIKRRVNDILTPNGTMILTFDMCSLPENVKIGWTNLNVREYIPEPRRCYKCQRFGHGSKACRSTDDRCDNCGEWGHKIMPVKMPRIAAIAKKLMLLLTRNV